MNKHTREHQDYERARRESRLQAVKNDPEAMQRMGLDPEALKKAISTSISDAFQEADENQDGSLQWPEFYNAACKLLEEQGMEDQTDQLKNFINAEFMTMDVDRSAGVEENEFAAWYVRFHDWIAEHRELRDAGIDVHAVDVIMPEGAGEELLTTVVRYCKQMHGLKASGELSVQSIQMLAQLRKGMLHRVDFSGCGGVSDLAIKPFAFYCPELQSLKLDGCDVSDEGMSAVAKNCKALRVVSVEGCRCTDASLQFLHAACATTGGVDQATADARKPRHPQPVTSAGRARSDARLATTASYGAQFEAAPPAAAAPEDAAATRASGAKAKTGEQKSSMCALL